jgi:hypothetical protein
MDDYWFWVIVTWALVIGVWLWSRKIDREVKAMEKDIKLALNKILFMRIEEHDGRLFAYNAINSEFICQGANKEELGENFGKRYPEHKGVIVEPDKETA